jgi:hypothetical protein
VTISTAASGECNVDFVRTLARTRALAHNDGRIVVVVATTSVNRSRNRIRARFAVDLDFPTTPPATTDNAQIVVVKDSHYRLLRLFGEFVAQHTGGTI